MRMRGEEREGKERDCMLHMCVAVFRVDWRYPNCVLHISGRREDVFASRRAPKTKERKKSNDLEKKTNCYLFRLGALSFSRLVSFVWGIACFVRFFLMVLCVCILHVYDSSRSLLPFVCACISVYYCSVSLLSFMRFNWYLFANSSGAVLPKTLLSVPLPSSSTLLPHENTHIGLFYLSKPHTHHPRVIAQA